jgi:hypothetical protein
MILSPAAAAPSHGGLAGTVLLCYHHSSVVVQSCSHACYVLLLADEAVVTGSNQECAQCSSAHCMGADARS